MYTKREALRHISKPIKYSNERGSMIKFMVDEGYVPCSAKSFYKLIMRAEEKHLPIGDEGGSGCRNIEKASERKAIPEREPVYLERFVHRESPDEDIFPRQQL